MQLYCRVSYKDKELVKSCVEALKDKVISLGPVQSLDFIERHNKVNYTVELRCLPFKNDLRELFASYPEEGRSSPFKNNLRELLDKAFTECLFDIEHSLQSSYRFRDCWYAYGHTAGYSDKKLKDTERYFI